VDFAKLTQAAAETKAAPLMVIDDSRTLQSISADIRRMKDENGLRVVVIDYLQRVTIEGSKEDRWHDIGRVSNALKDLAMDTGTTVVALAQLNRDVEKEGREPNLADLRGSAEIEADADVIAFLWRKEDALQFSIGKSRMGITSPVPIHADYDTGRMTEERERP
jgi:replicative DNA helicase